jgi:hypothetical protein
LVRISFRTGRRHVGQIEGSFENVGVGPALNLRHGVCDSTGAPIFENYLGGLTEGGTIKTWDNQPLIYPSKDNPKPVAFCEYENRFGDRYRVELGFGHKERDSALDPTGHDRFFVMSVTGMWTEIEHAGDR